MITPRSEKLCGNLAVVIADDFSYEAELSFGYLALEGGNSTKEEEDCFVFYVLVFYLRYTNN